MLSRPASATSPSGAGAVGSTIVVAWSPAVSATIPAPGCTAPVRIARLTAWRCVLARRRNADDVAPVGTLLAASCRDIVAAVGSVPGVGLRSAASIGPAICTTRSGGAAGRDA